MSHNHQHFNISVLQANESTCSIDSDCLTKTPYSLEKLCKRINNHKNSFNSVSQTNETYSSSINSNCLTETPYSVEKFYKGNMKSYHKPEKSNNHKNSFNSVSQISETYSSSIVSNCLTETPYSIEKVYKRINSYHKPEKSHNHKCLNEQTYSNYSVPLVSKTTHSNSPADSINSGGLCLMLISTICVYYIILITSICIYCHQ